MATPSPISVEIIRGDDEVLNLAFKNSDGTPADLTGHQGIWLTAKRSSLDADASAVFQKSTGVGSIVIDNLAGGLAHVVIDAADTTNVEPITLHYDCQLKDSLGKVRTAAMGPLKIVADVTRVS